MDDATPLTECLAPLSSELLLRNEQLIERLRHEYHRAHKHKKQSVLLCEDARTVAERVWIQRQVWANKSDY